MTDNERRRYIRISRWVFPAVLRIASARVYDCLRYLRPVRSSYEGPEARSAGGSEDAAEHIRRIMDRM